MSLLEAEGLEFSYRETPVLRDVDLSLGAGEVLGLIGPNGAGKTSLLRLLAGLAVPEQGVVNWDGQSLAGLSGKTLARLLAYMPQGAPAHWPLTVERVVELGRIPHRSWWQGLSAADSEAVNRAMAQADVERLRHRVVTTLSGGERARVMLARVLATGSRVILADEPVASLDPFHQLQVMRNLREHADGGGAVLVVLHDLNLAAHFCDRLVLLDLGAVACEGPTREVLENPLLEAVYAVRIDVTEAFGLPWVRFR